MSDPVASTQNQNTLQDLHNLQDRKGIDSAKDQSPPVDNASTLCSKLQAEKCINSIKGNTSREINDISKECTSSSMFAYGTETVDVVAFNMSSASEPDICTECMTNYTNGESQLCSVCKQLFRF